MARLSDAEIAQRLVKAGFLPSLVETALQVADAVDQALPTEIDVAQDSVVTETDVALAQVFWFYSPDVPNQYKRLLTGKVRNAARLESRQLDEFNPNHDRLGRFASASGQWVPTDAVAQRFSGDNFREFTSASQAHAVLSKKYADWADSLSKDEAAALKTYQVGQYDRINDGLRAGKAASEVPLIDSALAKSSAPYNFITFRAAAARQYKVGETFTEKGYTSTTVAPHVADRYRQQRGDDAVIVRVHVRGGQRAGYLSAVQDTEDYEVLLPRGSRFVIKSVAAGEFWGRATRVIDVELLD